MLLPRGPPLPKWRPGMARGARRSPPPTPTHGTSTPRNLPRAADSRNGTLAALGAGPPNTHTRRVDAAYSAALFRTLGRHTGCFHRPVKSSARAGGSTARSHTAASAARRTTIVIVSSTVLSPSCNSQLKLIKVVTSGVGRRGAPSASVGVAASELRCRWGCFVLFCGVLREIVGLRSQRFCGRGSFWSCD